MKWWLLGKIGNPLNQTIVCFVAVTMAPSSCDISYRATVPSLMKATGRNVKQAAKVLRRCEQFVRLLTNRSRRGDGFGDKPGGRRKRKLSAKAAATAKELACGKRKLAATRLQGVIHCRAHGGSRQSTHKRALLETWKTPRPMLSNARQAAAAHGHSQNKTSSIGE
jgi:transposase